MAKERVFIDSFTVEGGGEFPFDMLRYDQCWPTGSMDAAAITHEGKRRVALNGVAGLPGNYPTHARWLSFGWRVVSYTVTA